MLIIIRINDVPLDHIDFKGLNNPADYVIQNNSTILSEICPKVMQLKYYVRQL